MADGPLLHQMFFVADGLPAGVARVRGLSADEGLSRPYRIEIDLELPATQIDPAAWLHAAAAAIVAKSDGTVLRRFGGVVTRVREHARRVEPHRLKVTLQPPLAMLRLTTDHRIFQEQSSKEIVAKLLDEGGIDAATIDWRLGGDPPKREVCTQYGEDNLTFITRLLEEDGLFYFHEHTADAAKLVIGDSGSAYSAGAAPEIPFRTESSLVSDGAITGLSMREAVRPAKVTLRDHDFKRPALDLEATAEGDAPLGREFYDYPGRYTEPSEGKRRAQLQLDAFAAAAQGITGTATAFELTAGHTFKIGGAPEGIPDVEWVVGDIEHAFEDPGGSASSYVSRFRLLQKDLPFRPRVSAPRGRVEGPQLATVTGPAGEEIHTDEHGRIKVKFPWDRRSKADDKSSAWVRVTQMHSSGSVAIPRVGWEVVVDFEDGDPDKPVAIGRLYNGMYPPPYPLPANKTRSSLQSASTPGGGGYNEIRMEDGGGGEQVHMHAQKDQNVVVASNKTEKVATNSNLGVGSNRTVTVGADCKQDVGADAGTEVGGSQTIAVGGSRTETVSGDESIDVKGSRSLTIGGSHTTMTPMSSSASTPASFSETVGGSGLELAALGVGMAVAGVATTTTGGARIAASATGASAFTLGAFASTVGGAFINASGADCNVTVGGAKATTVGGAWAANAGGDVEISSGSALNITVGGILSFNAASIVLKVGGSNVTISAGAVSIKSSDIKLTATGPQPELAPIVADK